jgi:hypothetical protein
MLTFVLQRGMADADHAWLVKEQARRPYSLASSWGVYFRSASGLSASNAIPEATAVCRADQ